MANDTITSTSGDTTQNMNANEPSENGAMELLNKAYGYKLPTVEDRKIEQKRRKQQEIVSSISDAVQAMSNLFFASKGAPNMYDASKTQTKQLRERWDKADKEEREAAKGYLDGYLKILGHQQRQRIAEQQQKAQQHREKRNELRNGTLVRNGDGYGYVIPKEVITHNFLLHMASYLNDHDLHSVGLMRSGSNIIPLGTTPQNYRDYGVFSDSRYPNREGFSHVKWDNLWDLITFRTETNDSLYNAMEKYSQGLYNQRYEDEE